MRLEPGDSITLFDGEGAEAEARIESIDRRTVVVELLSVRSSIPFRGPCISIACPLIKLPRMDLLMEKAVELGADNIVPVRFQRSVPELDEKRAESRMERWTKIMASAAAQCGRTRLPRLHPPLSGVEEAISCEALTLNASTFGVLLETRASSCSLPSVFPEDLIQRKRIVLVVGPEGGLTGDEVNLLEQAGFVAASMGRLILRSETAVMAALTLAAAASGRMGVA